MGFEAGKGAGDGSLAAKWRARRAHSGKVLGAQARLGIDRRKAGREQPCHPASTVRVSRAQRRR